MNIHYKLPFSACPGNVYIRDAAGHVVFNWLSRDEVLLGDLIQAINTESILDLPGITSDDECIYLEGKPILLVRGWGYLTGCGGLGLCPEDAKAVQTEVLEYVKERLSF